MSGWRKRQVLELALEALEEAWYHVGTFQPTEKAIDLYDEARTAIKEALAKEKALQVLHNENERLGLYKDAYAQPEQKPVAWMWDINNGAGYSSRGIGFYQTDIPFAKHTPLYTTPPQRKETEQEPVAWVDLLKEAQQIVESKVLWKRFIDGTPLSNDIACWMAAFAQQHTTPPQRKEKNT